jgi:hypothetical protein
VTIEDDDDENHIVTHLVVMPDCIEGDELIYSITVSDLNADVYWTVNGENEMLLLDQVEKKNLGNGTHLLIIKQCRIKYSGPVVAKTYTNIGNKTEESKSTLSVLETEEKPVMDPLGSLPPTKLCRVGIACTIEIPYEVKGVRPTPLIIKVERDGSLLNTTTYFNMIDHTNRYELTIINPSIAKSGQYRIIFKNTKGEDEKTINITIADNPSPPISVTIHNIKSSKLSSIESYRYINGGSNTKFY